MGAGRIRAPPGLRRPSPSPSPPAWAWSGSGSPRAGSRPRPAGDVPRGISADRPLAPPRPADLLRLQRLEAVPVADGVEGRVLEEPGGLGVVGLDGVSEQGDGPVGVGA